MVMDIKCIAKLKLEILLYTGLCGMVNSNIKLSKAKIIILNHFFYHSDHEKVAKLLIESGSDVNAENYSKNTPLQWAAWGGRYNMTKLLIKSGGNVHSRNNDNNTPLHDAAKFG